MAIVLNVKRIGLDFISFKIIGGIPLNAKNKNNHFNISCGYNCLPLYPDNGLKYI